jgi:hypothetical protein
MTMINQSLELFLTMSDPRAVGHAFRAEKPGQ